MPRPSFLILQMSQMGGTVVPAGATFRIWAPIALSDRLTR